MTGDPPLRRSPGRPTARGPWRWAWQGPRLHGWHGGATASPIAPRGIVAALRHTGCATTTHQRPRSIANRPPISRLHDLSWQDS